MKHCPKCSIDYFDEMLEFCLEDGTKLISVSQTANETAAITRENKPNPLTDKTLNLPFAAKVEPIEKKAKDALPSQTKNEFLEKKQTSAAYGILEILPLIIALAHNWWQWIYMSNQYYPSVSSFLLSANFLMWLLLLIAGTAVGLFSLKHIPKKSFAIASLVILSINLILFLVPRR